MKEYRVLDTFSYVSKDIIDLERLEEIFYHGIDDIQGEFEEYCVLKYGEFNNTNSLIDSAVNELLGEHKRVAFIVKKDELIAIIGYL